MQETSDAPLHGASVWRHIRRRTWHFSLVLKKPDTSVRTKPDPIVSKHATYLHHRCQGSLDQYKLKNYTFRKWQRPFLKYSAISKLFLKHRGHGELQSEGEEA